MFADVIIDISVDALDRSFQYRVPKEWEKTIRIGMPVSVPFGRGNRMISGFVVGLSETPLWPEEKIKDLSHIREQDISVEGKLMELAGWIHERYGGTMNDALKTVLPVRKQIKSVEEHWLNFAIEREKVKSELEKCLKKHYTAKARLLQGMLDEGGEMTTALAAAKYKVPRTVVNKMVADGTLIMTDKKQYRNPVFSVEKEKEGKTLNDVQKRIADHFLGEYRAGIRRPYLLYGVTGSGKTEVYMEMIQTVLEEGRQVIVLIPEIALTLQTVERFKKRFGERVSILNSRMSDGEKYDQYERAKKGEIDIIVGPRSALFIPFDRLGLIVMDEEHEGSYKSENSPKYHARETALAWADMMQASVVFGSATPSTEACFAASEGKFHLYRMTERAGGALLPAVYVADLREELKNGNRSVFSRILQKKIEERLKKGEQTILFLNRRGYAGFVSCRSCGYVLKCPHCDISMTAHKNHVGNPDELVCHYCGHAAMMPEVCPSCGSPYIAAFGLGTQKVEEMLTRRFPGARVLRMDSDTTAGKHGHENVLDPFRRGEADILVGTQMIVKGHDFPNVTLVAALAADLSMHAGDYRSGERTFDLLMQAAGRAGRGKKPGEMVIQTYDPDQYCIEAVKGQDPVLFYKNELAYRRLMGYPPYCEMTAVLITSKVKKEAKECSRELAEEIKKEKVSGISVIGPAPAGLTRIKDRYRFVLYFKGGKKESALVRVRIEQFSKGKKWGKTCSIQVDTDPIMGY